MNKSRSGSSLCSYVIFFYRYFPFSRKPMVIHFVFRTFSSPFSCFPRVVPFGNCFSFYFPPSSHFNIPLLIQLIICLVCFTSSSRFVFVGFPSLFLPLISWSHYIYMFIIVGIVIIILITITSCIILYPPDKCFLFLSIVSSVLVSSLIFYRPGFLLFR